MFEKWNWWRVSLIVPTHAFYNQDYPTYQNIFTHTQMYITLKKNSTQNKTILIGLCTFIERVSSPG
jgi:hypothetical protein